MFLDFDFSSLPKDLSKLQPKKAKFCLQIEHFLKDKLCFEHSLQGSTIIVALSAGADSSALLFILYYLRARLGFELKAAHLDHSLREESAKEALWIQKLCAHLNIVCVSRKVDVATLAQNKKIGIEEAGRLARYSLFSELAQASQSHTNFICTGHHLDDLTEDSLIRLIRGSGWPALAGMKAAMLFDVNTFCNNTINTCTQTSTNTYLLRPLLMTLKSELIDFLKSLPCPWCEDESNQSLNYRRNRIRNQIMPLILKENPNFKQNIANLWNLAAFDEEYWSDKIQNLAAQNVPPTGLIDAKQTINKAASSELFIPIATILNEAKASRLRLYKFCLEKLGSGQVLARSLFELDDAVINKRSRKTFVFSHNKRVLISRSGLTFCLISGQGAV